jgi:hypothetical protein
MLELIGWATVSILGAAVTFYAVLIVMLLRGASLEDVPAVILKSLVAAGLAAALILLLSGCGFASPLEGNLGGSYAHIIPASREVRDLAQGPS